MQLHEELSFKDSSTGTTTMSKTVYAIMKRNSIL